MNVLDEPVPPGQVRVVVSTSDQRHSSMFLTTELFLESEDDAVLALPMRDSRAALEFVLYRELSRTSDEPPWHRATREFLASVRVEVRRLDGEPPD